MPVRLEECPFGRTEESGKDLYTATMLAVPGHDGWSYSTRHAFMCGKAGWK